jgi:uncharacterized protein (DUF1697 family)
MTSARLHVALLRGINVGGKNLLPMARLARRFEAIGCQAVRTYIQSGNVIFAASAALARRVPETISQAIRAEAGLEVPVIVRTAHELAEVARAHPFRKANVEPKTLHIAFLADTPTAAQLAALDPDRSPPDEFVVRGREIYLHLPNGVARTRLTNAYFDSKLDTVSTLRGVATVDKLVELCRG